MILAIQNIVHKDSVFARIADGRADFLKRRIVSGPIPALTNFAFSTNPEGYTITSGTPTWEGMGVARCEETLNDIGPRAFLSECQHNVDEVEGALWTMATLQDCRVAVAPEMVRVIVAIDPAVTSGEASDETGIVVAGLGANGHAYVLEDLSGRYTPDQWATKAIHAADRHSADRIVAEVNNGGELVENVLRTVDPNASYKAVRASRGKAVRAEPIAALYEQCVAKGSLVSTALGDVAIERVRQGDRVWTRKGLRRVDWAGSMGTRQTVVVETESGESITCTPEHPVFVARRGFVPAIQLAPTTDRLVSCINALTATPRLPERARLGADLVPHVGGGLHANQNESLSRSSGCVTTVNPVATGELEGIAETNYSIEPYGHLLMGLFPTAGMSTTSTRTLATTTSLILSLSPFKTTYGSNTKFISPMSELSERPSPAKRSHGGRSDSLMSTFVRSAEFVISQQPRGSDSVLPPVTRTTGTVKSVTPGPIVEVFDLQIAEAEEFFASGLLVHNCRVHHVGFLQGLEEQLTSWTPGSKSPDRLDALVWSITELMPQTGIPVFFGAA